MPTAAKVLHITLTCHVLGCESTIVHESTVLTGRQKGCWNGISVPGVRKDLVISGHLH